MVIKTIEKINNKCVGVIEANKLRMKMIQDNIKDLNLIDSLFSSLEEAILKKSIKEINAIISMKLFFEEICEGIEHEIINAYERQTNKQKFIDELKKSYIIRGVKGIQFSWMPIILRRG